MSEAAPEWKRARYGETETLRLGIVSVEISRPIGTRGGPRPKLYIQIGDHRLKKEFDDYPEARSYGLTIAIGWLEQALDRAKLVPPQAVPTPSNPNRSE